MTWTVDRRITLAFGVSVALLLAIAGVGWWALSRTAQHVRDRATGPAHDCRSGAQLESEARAVNAYQLRYLLERSEAHVRGRDSTMRVLRARLAQLGAAAQSTPALARRVGRARARGDALAAARSTSPSPRSVGAIMRRRCACARSTRSPCAPRSTRASATS